MASLVFPQRLRRWRELQSLAVGIPLFARNLELRARRFLLAWKRKGKPYERDS
jgi:hypothetical protein